MPIAHALGASLAKKPAKQKLTCATICSAFDEIEQPKVTRQLSLLLPLMLDMCEYNCNTTVARSHHVNRTSRNTLNRMLSLAHMPRPPGPGWAGSKMLGWADRI